MPDRYWSNGRNLAWKYFIASGTISHRLLAQTIQRFLVWLRNTNIGVYFTQVSVIATQSNCMSLEYSPRNIIFTSYVIIIMPRLYKHNPFTYKLWLAYIMQCSSTFAMFIYLPKSQMTALITQLLWAIWNKGHTKSVNIYILINDLAIAWKIRIENMICIEIIFSGMVRS